MLPFSGNAARCLVIAMSKSMEPRDLTPEDLQRMGELESYQEYLQGEFDRARDQETEALNQLDKSLWLANGGAATVTISNLVASSNSVLFFCGASAFVIGIAFLLMMRMSHAYNAARDRSRRQKASEKLFTENLKLSSLEGIRDRWYFFHGGLYRKLNTLAALMFVFGCAFSLAGAFPELEGPETHNKSLKSGAAESAAP